MISHGRRKKNQMISYVSQSSVLLLLWGPPNDFDRFQKYLTDPLFFYSCGAHRSSQYSSVCLLPIPPPQQQTPPGIQPSPPERAAPPMASPPPPDPAPPPSAGLESMEGLVIDTVISKAGARPAAVLACASTRLRAAVADESLWRRFCAEDLGLDAPVDPDGQPLPSFQVSRS